MINLIVLIIAGIGAADIIISSPLSIFRLMRYFCPKLFTCYQCTGFWTGFILSFGVYPVSNNYIMNMFMCGFIVSVCAKQYPDYRDLIEKIYHSIK